MKSRARLQFNLSTPRQVANRKLIIYFTSASREEKKNQCERLWMCVIRTCRSDAEGHQARAVRLDWRVMTD